MNARRYMAALISLGWACGGHVDIIDGVEGDASLNDAALAADAEVPLALSDARCRHDRFDVLIEGQPLDCSVAVTGTPERSASLTCEDASGAPMDCCLGTLGPCTGVLDFDTSINAPTVGLAGEMFTLVIVATDGIDTVRRRYDFPVIADDGVNVPPRLEAIPCGGSTDISVPEGISRGCSFDLVEPDPQSVAWSTRSVFGSAGSMSPTVGTATPPVERIILWFHHDGRAGSRVWEVELDDGVAPPEIATVRVQFE